MSSWYGEETEAQKATQWMKDRPRSLPGPPVGCKAGGLSEGCQAHAWLPHAWRNASLMLGGPWWRGVVTGDSPGTLGVGGARRAAGVSQPLHTVPRGAGGQLAWQWRLGQPGCWGGPGPGAGCPVPYGLQHCGSGARGAQG